MENQSSTTIRVAAATILFAYMCNAALASDPASYCADALMVKNIAFKNYSRQSQLAWMRLVNNSNYEKIKQDAKAMVPGYFDGDYHSFNEKRASSFLKENYNSTEYEAQQELSIETPKEAVSAWQNCISSNSVGLFAYVKNVDESGATISINWRPAPGLKELNSVYTELSGAKSERLSNLRQIDIGEGTFLINRGGSTQAVRGIIMGRTSTGGVYSAEIYIPAKAAKKIETPIKPVVPEKYKPLFVGQTPNCNAAIITSHQNHLNCVNIPYGYTVNATEVAQQNLYLGVEPNKNAGVVTTKANFHGGQTTDYGWTIRDQYKMEGSKQLFVVVGCGANDGEVTNNPTHKNCPTAPIGWAYPW